MSQFVGRFVIISLLVAIALLGLGTLFLQQPGVRLSKFEQAQASHFAATKPEEPPLDVIVVTPCSNAHCLLVQAGGREFVVGASLDAAKGLVRKGLLSDQLDGVILTDLSSDQIDGLIGLRDRSLEAGRSDMLKVYGPSGVERVVEGLNAMLETSDVDRSVRFGQGVLPFDIAPAEAIIVDEDPANQKIFDSGVLQIHAFPVDSTLLGAEVLYRFDYEEKSLIVGGCGTRLVDVKLAQKGGADQSVLVLPAASKEQLEIIREQANSAGFLRESRFATAPADRCLTPAGIANVVDGTGADYAIAAPLFPAPTTMAEERIWKSEIKKTSENASVSMQSGQIWSPITLSE